MNNQSSFDIGQSLTFMFEEEDWVMKFIIMTLMVLFSFFIVPLFIMQGYVIEIARRVAYDQRPALPTWDNWGVYLSDGLKAFGAALAYALPSLVLTFCSIIPLTVMADDTTGELSGAAVSLMFCVACLAILLQIPFLVFYLAGIAEFAATKDFGAFFRFTQLWAGIRRNNTSYLFLIAIVFLANLVGGFIPIIGYTWTQFVTGHALGQYMRRLGPREIPAEQPPLSTSF